MALLYQPISMGEDGKIDFLALDVAYLGSITAGKIFIVATDKGVGIKNAGVIASTSSNTASNSGLYYSRR